MDVWFWLWVCLFVVVVVIVVVVAAASCCFGCVQAVAVVERNAFLTELGDGVQFAKTVVGRFVLQPRGRGCCYFGAGEVSTHRHTQTHTQTQTQTDRQTDRQTGRQTARWTDRQAGRQRHSHAHTRWLCDPCVAVSCHC